MSQLDQFNPLWKLQQENKLDTSLLENAQNVQYGSDRWYPLLQDWTPKSQFIQLESEVRESIANGAIGGNLDLLQLQVESLIQRGYKFFKTPFASAHAFRPMESWQDFVDQITNPRIIMSFRRYPSLNSLMFRKWTEMNLECRCYVYKSKLHYMEVYRDEKQEFQPSMFGQMYHFLSNQVIPKLKSLYSDFTIDLYYQPNSYSGIWRIVEINSPVYLKAGLYLINYEWEKHRIHMLQNFPICRYRDQGEIQELCPETFRTFIDVFEPKTLYRRNSI